MAVNIINRTEEVRAKVTHEFVNSAMDFYQTPNLSQALEKALRHRYDGNVPWTVITAGLVETTTMAPYSVMEDVGDFERNMCTVRFQVYAMPTAKGITAWNNLTGGREYDGDTASFCQILEDYGEIYAEALATAVHAGNADGWTLESRIASVLKLAGDNEPFSVVTSWLDPELRGFQFRDWEQIKGLCSLGGLNSMLEAYEAGVPVEDIIA